MSRDPAVEAAKRAMIATHGWPEPNADLISAAREMAKPIRDLVELSKKYGDYVRISELAPLIYTSEELNR